MKAFLIGLVALISLPSPGAYAGENPRTEQPGYVDFGELATAYGEPRVMINIGSSLLRLINAIKHEDPVATEVLRDMESIHVHVYDTHGEMAPAVERMAAVRDGLAADAWEQVVRANEDGKKVEIFVKQDERAIQGLAVMAVDVEEAVFINVLGSVQPDQLASVMETMDVGVDLDL